jgi:hypothetical protein
MSTLSNEIEVLAGTMLKPGLSLCTSGPCKNFSTLPIATPKLTSSTTKLGNICKGCLSVLNNVILVKAIAAVKVLPLVNAAKANNVTRNGVR